MNIKLKNENQVDQKMVNLNESEQPVQVLQSAQPSQEINTDLQMLVLKTKSKQFIFDCGAIMARINVDINNRFGLKWHYMHTKDVGEFIGSVRTYISSTGKELSENDIAMLIKQFEKQSKLI